MKKIGMIAALCMSSTVFASQGNHVYVKAGLDFAGRYQQGKYLLAKAKNSGGKFDVVGSFHKKDAKGLGAEIALEYTRDFTENLELGLGVAYQDHANTKAFTSAIKDEEYYRIKAYKSLPLYVTGKYHLPLDSSVKPYIKVDLGYSVNFGIHNAVEESNTEREYHRARVKNGLYWGLGVGTEYKNFITELSYQVNQAKVNIEALEGRKDIPSQKLKMDYGRVVLSVGYKFNF